MIHPLEDRYRTRIANTFEEQSRIDKMVQVELALAKAHFEQGTITEDTSEMTGPWQFSKGYSP